MSHCRMGACACITRTDRLFGTYIASAVQTNTQRVAQSVCDRHLGPLYITSSSSELDCDGGKRWVRAEADKNLRKMKSF